MAKAKPKVDWRIVVVGLVCLTILETVAMFMGINGTLLKLVLVVIALTIGVTIPLDKFIKLK